MDSVERKEMETKRAEQIDSMVREMRGIKAECDPNGTARNEAGAKLDHGKPQAALVLHGFPRALLAVSEVATFGAEKYTPNGWKEVPDGEERYTNALCRHLLSEGYEERDVDSGLRHAAQVAWNALARLELMLKED